MTLALVHERQTLPSWIDGFLELTSELPSPERFRRWAAITAVGAAIEQKVWVKTKTGPVYPNLFTILIGPSGAGKGVALNGAVELFIDSLEPTGKDDRPHVSPSSMSAASFIDALSASRRRVLRPVEVPNYRDFHSIFIPSRELGVLFPQYDSSFMNSLTDLYDGKPYRQTRRGNNIDIEVKNPGVTLLAGTTPSFLGKFLPPGAWTEGFISRVNLIYSGGSTPRSIFGDEGEPRFNPLERDLRTDLRIISNLYGKLGFEPAAASHLNDWHLAGGPPAPDHPKLFTYCERRTFHLIKLSIIACLARGNNRFEIEVQDVELATAWLLESEEHMPDIFRAMISGGDADVMGDAWHFIWQAYSKKKEPIHERRLYAFLSERVPSHSVERIIQVMHRGGLIIGDSKPEGMYYRPAPKKGMEE